MDSWILSRLHRTIEEVNDKLATYDMDEAARAIYAFFWDEYCDWYLEMCKPRLREPGADRFMAQLTLSTVLETVLRLLHPMIPFITEEIWPRLPEGARMEDGPETLMRQPYPEHNEEWLNEESERRMEIVIETTRALRNLRQELGIPPGQRLTAASVPSNPRAAGVLSDNAWAIESLARLQTLQLRDAAPAGEGKWVSSPLKDADVFLEIGEALDVPKELERIDKELAKLEQDVTRSRAKLDNPQFTERAPADIVQKERDFAAELEDKRSRLASRRRLLQA